MNILNTLYTRTRGTIAIIMVMVAALAIAAYSGGYFVASQINHEDPLKVMVTAYENATRDTSKHPIVIIVPEDSLLEKVEKTLGEPYEERETVTITTRMATDILIPAPSLITDAPPKGKAARAWGWIKDTVVFMD